MPLESDTGAIRPSATVRVVVAVFVLLLTATTTVNAGTFSYDVPTIARVDVHHATGADAAETQLTSAPEASASPSVEGRGASTTSSRSFTATEAGTLTMSGQGFSASEQRVAQLLADGGENVVLREATGVGRTSDLLVNGVPYDVYTPTTGNIDRIVSAVASKGSQVQGGGIIIDLSQSPLTVAPLGNILPRVQGVTSQISDIRVVP